MHIGYVSESAAAGYWYAALSLKCFLFVIGHMPDRKKTMGESMGESPPLI